MQFDVSLINIVLAVLVAVATLWISVTTWRRSRGGWRIAGLELLRMLLIAVGVLTLFRPEFVKQQKPVQPNIVQVFCDESASMTTADVMDGENLVARGDSISALKDSQTWGDSGDNEFQVTSFGSQGERSTNLHQVLTEVIDNPEGVRAVVLASDGDWNSGESPADAARKLRQLDIPVFTVTAGSEKPLPDLAIENFDIPTFAIIGKPLRIPFTVASTLPHPTKVAVTVTLPGQDKRVINVRVPASGKTESVVSWRPPRVGDETISISIAVPESDSIEENNQASLPVNIRYESLKVLMIESFPRWEYRYTRNALVRDPGATVNTLLLHPDFEGNGGGPGYLAEFPSKESLFDYDVVFLGDVGVGPNQLTTAQCEQLQQLVKNHAGGLVLLPGFRGFQNSLADTVLDELSPVQMDPAHPKGVRTTSPGYFQLTEDGLSSLLTRFESSAETNSDVWRALPGFFWHSGALRSKPGATTLAVHSSAANRFGRVPLIVTRPYGNGKVLFAGSDGAWRWRKGVEDLYHYRFWSQMIRWMAYQRTMSAGKSLRVVFSPDRPRSGDTVTLMVNAMAQNGEPLQEGNITTQIQSPDGSISTLNLSKDSKDQWGLFRGSFVAQSGGKYQLKTRCLETQSVLDSTINVLGSPLEQIGKPARKDVMREIAAITQGRMVDADQVQQVVTALQDLPEAEMIVHRDPLWSHPGWAMLLIGLLAVFWTGRKYTGLV